MKENTLSHDVHICPLIRLANWISLCMIVTLFACIAQRFVSSNK